MELMIPGLESPGPIYMMPSCFDRAAIKSKHPTWGPRTQPAHKAGRFRDDEIRFDTNRQMRVMYGHFSPGPQYSVPGCFGGAGGNYTAAKDRLLAIEPQGNARGEMSAMPYTNAPPPTAKLSATQLGGAMEFTMTRGSFADPDRKGGGAAAQQSTEFWRTATMLQPNEPNLINAPPDPLRVTSRHASGALVGDSTVQDEIKKTLAERWRPEPRLPHRQVADRRSDPPLANVFGSAQAHTDHGGIGGLDREWRESKVVSGNGGPKFARPSTGPLRYAFIQPSGLNKIPHGTAKTDFNGGRPDYSLPPGSTGVPRTATLTARYGRWG